MIPEKKKCVNVIGIGHVDHGKSLTSAVFSNVASVLNDDNHAYQIKDLDKSPDELKRGITINSATISLETKHRIYAFTDCPGHRDYIANMLRGADNADVGILVVSLFDGAMPQTIEHLTLAKNCQLKKLYVYYNKMDLFDLQDANDKEMAEWNKDDVKDLIQASGFSLDAVKFFQGSSLRAMQQILALKKTQNFEELKSKIRKNFEDRNDDFSFLSDEYCYIKPILSMLIALENEKIERDHKDKDFYMPISTVHSIKGKGTVVTGKVLLGTCNMDQNLEIVGCTKVVHGPVRKSTSVKGIQIFFKDYESVTVSDNCGICLRGVERDEISSGQVLVNRAKYKLYHEFECTVSSIKSDAVDAENESSSIGRRKPFGKQDKFQPQFYVACANITCVLKMPDGVEMIMPGEIVNGVVVKLTEFYPLLHGMKFSLREGKTTIANCVITKLIK